jgi:two-component system chemotaxis response regulator CheB
MGRDGAEGMLKLHERGAYTMAQDETSSTVFGMPGEAIKLGAVDMIGNPRQIQMKIHDILGFKKKLAS